MYLSPGSADTGTLIQFITSVTFKANLLTTYPVRMQERHENDKNIAPQSQLVFISAAPI